MDTVARIGWASHECLIGDTPQPQTVLTQLESIRDEAFGSMQHIQRDLRMRLGTFDRLDAGSSSQTDTSRQAYVQHVHSGGQRNKQGARRRPRVRRHVDEDEHTFVHTEPGDSYVLIVQQSPDASISTAADAAQSAFFHTHGFNTYDPFRTSTQVPAFGGSSNFAASTYGANPGDDIIYNYLANLDNFATTSHRTTPEVGTYSNAIPSYSVPQSCPHCRQNPVISYSDNDDESTQPVHADV